MKKKVAFKVPAPPPTADAWVSRGAEAEQEQQAPPPKPAEPMKRLTIDVPLSLHTRIKTGCAASGRKIADVARELLEQEFPPKA
jgi:hypothetical protein